MPPTGRPDPSAPATTVLVVEDEPSLLDLMSRTFELSGFAVRRAGSLGAAVDDAAAAAPDIAVLDVMLPDGSGLDLIHRLREVVPGLPVVVVTARDAVGDRLTGFALGADDYVCKPFNVAELVARVRAVLRRSPSPDRGTRPWVVADLVLDDAAHVVRRGPVVLDLSPTEYRLLRHLMAHAGRVLSRMELLDHVWDYREPSGAAVVEKFVSQVRRKVDRDGVPPLVHTVRGFGYVLREPRPIPERPA
jgi:two-component system OmpR family response regulator